MAISIVTGDSIPLEASFRRLPCHLHLSDRRQAFRFDKLSFLDVSCGRLRFYLPDKDQQFTRFDLKLLPARTLWCPDVRLYVATFFQFPVSIPVSAITLFEGGIFVRFPGYLEMDLLAETDFMHQRILREQLALGLFDRQQASEPARRQTGGVADAACRSDPRFQSGKPRLKLGTPSWLDAPRRRDRPASEKT